MLRLLQHRLVSGLGLLLAVGLLASSPSVVDAQEKAERTCAPLYLPSGHWAADQAVRLERAGLLETGFPGGSRSLALEDVLGALSSVSDSTLNTDVSSQQRDSLEATLSAHNAPRWLSEEVRRLRTPCGAPASRSVNIEQFEVALGAVRQNPEGVAERGGEANPSFLPSAEVRTALSFGDRLTIGGHGHVVSNHLRADQLYGALRLGSFGVWAGRRSPGYGAARAGTVVLSGQVPLDGVGFRLRHGRRLPSVLGHLGPIRFETLVARMSDSGTIERPWFWAGRVAAEPARWLRVAVNRGAFIGGEGTPSVGARELFYIFWGSRPKQVPDGYDGTRSDVANQVASLEAELRLRVSSTPVHGYLEWGFEDSSGAWLRQPGIVAGLQLPMLAPSLTSFGVEVATLHAPNRHGVWYQHRHFDGGWADRGRLLGHPLAGPGREYRVYSTHRGLAGRLYMDVDLFHRNRHEMNALAPQGVSRGFSLESGLTAGRLGASFALEMERWAGEGNSLVRGLMLLRWHP